VTTGKVRNFALGHEKVLAKIAEKNADAPESDVSALHVRPIHFYFKPL
jgi:hypothetical protein